MLAMAGSAIIIGFHVDISAVAKELAETEGVDVRLYNIIYKAIEDIELAMEGLLEPEYEEAVLGHIEVRSLFKSSKIGTIAGCYVIDGKAVRNAKIRIMRSEEEVFAGHLNSLKRFKEDAKEVEKGFECGVVVPDFNDFQVGDSIEVYEMRQKLKRKSE
jgi:translation initiation factor IF-2